MDTSLKIQNILRKILGEVPNVEDISRQNFPDWDSLASISILFELEEQFGIEFTDEQIEQMSSYLAICSVVAEAQDA